LIKKISQCHKEIDAGIQASIATGCLKKNTQLPNKILYPFILTTFKKGRVYDKSKIIKKINSNRIYKYKYSILPENTVSDLHPNFLNYFNINRKYCKISVKECDNSFLLALYKATNIKIMDFVKDLNFYQINYNVNIIIMNQIDRENIEIVYSNDLLDYNENRKTVILLCYKDLNLKIKYSQYDILTYNKKLLLSNNNSLVKEIIYRKKKIYQSNKEYSNNIKKSIKVTLFTNVIEQCINDSGKCIFIKIKTNPDLWISCFDAIMDNVLIGKIYNDKLVTYSDIIQKYYPIKYDIRNQNICGFWTYLNNILVYIPVKQEIMYGIVSKNDIKHNILYNNFIYNVKYEINYMPYFLHDLIVLLFTYSNMCLEDFINNYLTKIENFCQNSIFN